MSDFNWECPHCGRAVTISVGRTSMVVHEFGQTSADGLVRFFSRFIQCPNPECKRLSLRGWLSKLELNAKGEWKVGPQIRHWSLVPSSGAKVFPEYIPKPIREDYQEACAIRELSPKASATLSRRCLQGMLRDFWKVKPGNLINEIDQLEDKVEPEVWEAINAVRRIGNIGAHMGRDINVIVDVDENEAGLLIELIETLFAEWYVARAERQKRLAAVKAAADAKKPPND